MSALQEILRAYRDAAISEREKGSYFEELIRTYLRNEATYRDLYDEVWLYADWARAHGHDARDAGIDLVAKTRGTDELHAVQCKNFAPDHRVHKKDIDSFFTASGKKIFSRRLIVTTTNLWSDHAEAALADQQPPVTKIDLQDLENSQIDWARYQPNQAPALKPRKRLRPHQEHALSAARAGLADTDRGKLIMACGTGKTFTSLKIAEAVAGPGKRVLFLVPSLALLSQTLTEWTQESATPLHSFAVCSDSDVGKKRKAHDDSVQTYAHELRYPATTDAARLASELAYRHDATHMSVVYATYHSIDVISRGQKEHGLPEFDLVVCDEAHRTTGATFERQEESHFVRVHDADYLRAAKRLYMTATPRIFGDTAKATAERDNIALCSMDDEALFGRQFYVITFSEAVKRGLLVDYKVIVLAVEESYVTRRIQGLLKDENNQLRIDDAAKIIGCWKALSKQGLSDDLNDDGQPMKRAVAFCQVIEPQTAARTHKVASKNIAAMFQAVVEAYQESAESDDEISATLRCEAEHVDGGMNASQKEAKLGWLKAEPDSEVCRILSNVRCLSEGVDVPALDAVLFLTPRNSQVDVVQSVGRVMRNAPGKRRGYVVLPVVIPAGVEPHEALNDNQTYKVVWQVLQALRSHDDRFDAMVNKLDLIGRDTTKMEVVAVTDRVQRKAAQLRTSKQKLTAQARGGQAIGAGVSEKPPEQVQLEFEIGEIERAIYAKLVQKVGNRHHWEDWAKDIAKIAATHVDRIRAILGLPSQNAKEQPRGVSADPADPAKTSFLAFAAELRDDLNDSLGDGEIIEMLAQHLITRPVFDALFEKYSFASHNPISKAMQGVLDVLQEHNIEKEADTLQSFYDSVKLRAEGIESAAGKQKLVVELYDKFFRNAFPKMAERLGIVYTPVEVVDFILHSVNHLLKTEFGETLGSKNVHILDPFTGTGTFITRLMQSGLISAEQLKHKYRHEIHANEIVLLAYYIAAINIEATYHDIVGGDYVPFEGICLTDTFQMYEKDDLVDQLLVDNSTRRKRQKALDIRVIVGNPPYSSGDKNDDNMKSVDYPNLDKSIEDTFVRRSSKSMGKSKIYDSYIRAIRWASDKVGSAGVVGLVTNAGWIESSSADGMRRCLAEEFSSLYVLHLRGNQRTSGETSRREGGKVFGSGSRAPIAISILIKNPRAIARSSIRFYDIGDHLSREEKLGRLRNFGGVDSIDWRSIHPDSHGDWLSQRSGGFERFLLLGRKNESAGKALFRSYSMGVKSNRDEWVYSSSITTLAERTRQLVGTFNAEVDRYHSTSKTVPVADFVTRDKAKIKWTTDILGDLEKGRKHVVEDGAYERACYRPYSKQWLYSSKRWNWSRHLMPRYFPSRQASNQVICVTGVGTPGGFSCLVTDVLPDLGLIGVGQCFPRYVYDERARGLAQSDLLKGSEVERHDGIASDGLAHLAAAYPEEILDSDDAFFYIYGILHSPDYRERYADNLSKELPRIPRVRTGADFWDFSKAGRALADLHLNYETVPMHAGATIDTGGRKLSDADYRVDRMKYGKIGKQKDLTTLIYNDRITVTGIPLEAYDYVVNGKAALDWVVERQCVKVDKDSGIVNDANDWAIETMNNPRYPLELFLRVITVSLETMKVVRALPALDILPD